MYILSIEYTDDGTVTKIEMPDNATLGQVVQAAHTTLRSNPKIRTIAIMEDDKILMTYDGTWR